MSGLQIQESDLENTSKTKLFNLISNQARSDKSVTSMMYGEANLVYFVS
jgi:hypothetical protein